MAAQGKLTLVNRGGTGKPINLDHGGAKLSWVINGPGEFSCVITDTVARRFGASGINWIGTRWLYYSDYADVPVWGGVITQVHWTPGQLEIVAQSFAVLLRKRRVNLNVGSQRATAGALASRAHSDVQSDDPTFIVEVQADETGDPIEFEWRGGDLMDDVFAQLVSASGQEWTVDADRILYWAARLGSDKSGSVALRHGIEIVDYTLTGDLWTCANDIEGVASDDKYASSAYDQIEDDDSVKLRGRLMVQIRYIDATNRGAIRSKITRDLRELRNPAQTIEVKTINVAHSWSRYHIGDDVLICLPGPDLQVVARIEARSIDIDTGIETLGMVIK